MEDDLIQTQDKDAQAIIDKLNGNGVPSIDDEEDNKNKLPSDVTEEENKLFADKYKNVDDLKKGITELKSTLPQYVIDGMSDSALEQHYVELRKNFSGKKDATDKTVRRFAEDEVVEEEVVEEKIVEKVKSSELWNDLQTNFEATGKVTSEMYDKLEEMGIPSDVVDNYVDGIHSKQVAFTNSVYEIAGGQEQFAEIKAWAEDGNISDAELDALKNMSYEAIIGSYKGIKARYDLAKGTNSVRITGSTNTNSGSGYLNQADYMKDVADRRYGQNRVYTESVDAKFSKSSFK
jgi:hypothetical protein